MIVYRFILKLCTIIVLLFIVTENTYSADSTFAVEPLGWVVDSPKNLVMGTFLLKNTSSDSVEITNIRYSGKTYLEPLTSFRIVVPPNKSIPIRWYSRYIELLYKNDFESFCKSYEKKWFKIHLGINTIINGSNHTHKVAFIPPLNELRYAPPNTSCLRFEPKTGFNQPITKDSLLDYYIYLENQEIRTLKGFVRLENCGDSVFQPKNVSCNTANFLVKIHSNSPLKDGDKIIHTQVQKGQSILLSYTIAFKDKRPTIDEFLNENKIIIIQLAYEGGFTEKIEVNFSTDRLIKIIH